MEASAALRAGLVRISCGHAHDRVSSRAAGRSARDLERDFSRRRGVDGSARRRRRGGRVRAGGCAALARSARARPRRRGAAVGAARGNRRERGGVAGAACGTRVARGAAGVPARAGRGRAIVEHAPSSPSRLSRSDVGDGRGGGVGAGGRDEQRHLARGGADRSSRRARDLAALGVAVRRADRARARLLASRGRAGGGGRGRGRPRHPLAGRRRSARRASRDALAAPAGAMVGARERGGAGRGDQRSPSDRDRLRQRSVGRRPSLLPRRGMGRPARATRARLGAGLRGLDRGRTSAAGAGSQPSRGGGFLSALSPARPRLSARCRRERCWRWRWSPRS